MSTNLNTSKPPDVDKISTWIDDMRSWPNVMYDDIYNYLISSKAVDGQEMKNFKRGQGHWVNFLPYNILVNTLESTSFNGF